MGLTFLISWFYIPNLFFEKCGGLNFLLSCDFKCSKLPIKLSNFHKQALDAWNIAFKHTFSPHTCIIWNKQHALSKRKSIYKKEWFDKGIIFISDLLNCNGEFLQLNDFYSYQQFLALSGIESTCRDYHMVVKNISIKLRELVKAHLSYNSV